MANIILDYDGTIHDCAKIYVPSFYIGYKYLTDNGLAPIHEYSYEEVSSYLGYSVLYSGAEEVLQNLKECGHNLIFLSNCMHDYMEAHRKVHCLDRFYCDFYCTEDFDFKSKPEIFTSIAKKHIGDFIIIGDRYLDIETAWKHNLKSIGCTYGYCEPHELDKADITVSEISEIPKAVEKLL